MEQSKTSTAESVEFVGVGAIELDLLPSVAGIVVFIEPEPGPTVEVESCSGTTVEASVGPAEVATGLEVGAGVSGQGTGSQVVDVTQSQYPPT